LELLRVKNKFAKVSPTHFRNMLCNIRLSFKGDVFFAEIQIHLARIYELDLGYANLSEPEAEKNIWGTFSEHLGSIL
jgi:hypothetical protein